MVFKTCEQTDKQTPKHADRNTLHPYRARSNDHILNSSLIKFFVL